MVILLAVEELPSRSALPCSPCPVGQGAGGMGELVPQEKTGLPRSDDVLMPPHKCPSRRMGSCGGAFGRLARLMQALRQFVTAAKTDGITQAIVYRWELFVFAM